MPLSDYPPYQLRNLRKTLTAHVPLKAARDVGNRLRYGPGAPLSDEPLFADPAAIVMGYKWDPARGAPRFRRGDSGRVVDGDWDLSISPIAETLKARAMRRHFIDGVPWEETGIIEETLRQIARKGVSDGLRCREEVLARYALLDRVFEEVRATGRMRLRADLPDRFRREHGGIFAHVGRDGQVLKAGGGVHRLTLARILGLPEVPVQIGVVHPQALKHGHLSRLRRSVFAGGEAAA